MQPLSVTEFNEVCTQFEDKTAVHLPKQQRTLVTAFASYRLQRGVYIILAIHLAYESRPLCFHVL